jgi:hypothetical protein
MMMLEVPPAFEIVSMIKADNFSDDIGAFGTMLTPLTDIRGSVLSSSRIKIK